jgi:hypothetical protein
VGISANLTIVVAVLTYLFPLSSNELLIDNQESNLGCNSSSIGGFAKGDTEGNGGLLARIEDSITVRRSFIGSSIRRFLRIA